MMLIIARPRAFARIEARPPFTATRPEPQAVDTVR
jgi:hypothetical protein